MTSDISLLMSIGLAFAAIALGAALLAVTGMVVNWIDRKLDGTHGRRYHGPGWGDD